MAEKKPDKKRTPDDHPRESNQQNAQPERQPDQERNPSDPGEILDETELGFVVVDPETNEVLESPLDSEQAEDSFTIGVNEDAVMAQIDDYTDDPEIIDDFAERQQAGEAGSRELLESLVEHNSRSPEVTGGDIDADWEGTYQSGEESVGGTVPTPDQDIVEDLGQAIGVEYKDDEPLNTVDKLLNRDQDRWELNPKSAEEGEDAFDISEDEDIEDLLEIEDLDEDEEETNPLDLSDDDQDDDDEEDLEDLDLIDEEEDEVDLDVLDEEEAVDEDVEEEDLDDEDDDFYDEDDDEDDFDFDDDDFDDLFDDEDDDDY